MRQDHIVFRYALLVLLLLAARSASAAERPSYAGGRFALDINGERQLVNSVEGGSAVGIVAANGTDKRIGSVKYEDIVFTIPITSLPKPLAEALDGRQTSVNGAIDYLDFDYKAQRRVSFQNASVSAIRFPALDGGSKEQAMVEVVLSPQQTREDPTAGDVKSMGAGSKQKAALRSAFRVVMPDNLPANRVATVSAIEVRRTATASVGAGAAERAPSKGSGQFEIPNIKLTMSPVDVKLWQQWLDKTLSELGTKQEKTMRVELLDATMKNVIAAVDLSGVGIVAIRTPKMEANSEAVQRVEIELYAEQLKFDPGTGSGDGTKSAAAAAPAETAPAPAEPAKSEPVLERPVRRAR
jgi:hypothetical protein